MQKAWLSPQDLPFHSRSCTLVYLLMGLFSSSKGVSSFYHFPDLCFTLVNKSPERGYKAAMICTRTGRDVFHDCLLMSSFSCFCQRHCVCTWNLLGDFSTHLLLINRLPLWPASFLCWLWAAFVIQSVAIFKRLMRLFVRHDAVVMFFQPIHLSHEMTVWLLLPEKNCSPQIC